MGPKKSSSVEADNLRRQAENFLLTQKSVKKGVRTNADTQRLLHELQVNQVELEIQNTELRQTRDLLEKALTMYTDLYDFAPVSYFTLARDGTIQAVNLSGADLLGKERSHLLGLIFAQFVTAADRAVFELFLGKIFTSRDKQEGEVTLLNVNQHPIVVRIEAVATASMQECLFALINITENKRYEEKLHFLSTRDALTGLFNRAFFDAELERLLDSRRYPVSIVIVDVDGLKESNDTFGHATGDQIIQLAAKVLRHAVRPEDVVARIGGDEFAILLPRTANAHEAILRIRQGCETISADHSVSPLRLSLGAATAQDSSQLRETILLADSRMYTEKHSKNEAMRKR